MSAHNTAAELFRSPVQLTDPGNAGTIMVDRSPCLVNLVSTAAQTRTLARPTRDGAIVTLHHRTDGGDITVTVTGGYNENGDTTFVFTDAGQFATFIAMFDGTNYFWRLLSSHLLTGPVLGYPTGTGGSVTQTTNRSTAVTLNTLTGMITTDTTSLAAEAAASFKVNNSSIAIGDVVVVSQRSGGNGGNTAVNVTGVAAGACTLQVSNNNPAAGTAETGAIVINFAVIRGASS